MEFFSKEEQSELQHDDQEAWYGVCGLLIAIAGAGVVLGAIGAALSVFAS